MTCTSSGCAVYTLVEDALAQHVQMRKREFRSTIVTPATLETDFSSEYEVFGT